jgi:hypothetical protein
MAASFSQLVPPRPGTPIVSRQLVVFVLDASLPWIASDLAHAVAEVAGRLRAGLLGGNVSTSSVVFDTEVRAVTETRPELTEDRILAELCLGGAAERFIGGGLSMAHLLAAWHLGRWDDTLPLSVSVLAAFAGPCNQQAETASAYAALTADARVTCAAAALADHEVEYSSDAGGLAPVVAGATELAGFWLRSHMEMTLRGRETKLLG